MTDEWESFLSGKPSAYKQPNKKPYEHKKVDRASTQEILDSLAIGSSVIPGVGDAMGIVADANMYKNDPESRTAGNFVLSTIGLLPFVPGAAGVVKRVKGGFSRTTDEASRMAAEYDRLVSARRKAFSRTTTDMPTYDNMIKNPEYFRREKGIDAKMIEITPQQYLDKVKSYQGPEVNTETVKRYAEKIRNGEQFPALTLDYSSGKLSQEGRHRALAAIEAGIDRVPVLEVRRMDF